VEEARAEERAARAAAEAEAQLEEVPLEQRLGPGGLDPVEVFESLPEPLQAAYEARDTDALRAFVGAMPTAEARVLMRQMVDSGLWVPEPGEEGTLLRGEEAAEGGA
jgi:cell division cycle protein 37